MSGATRTRWITVAVVALGVAMPAARAQEAAPADISGYERGWHIVRPGENLHLITRKYLGDKRLWRQNWELNPQIEDPDNLVPGQRIEVLVRRSESVPTALLRSVSGPVEERPAPIPWHNARELDLMLEEDGLRTGSRGSTEMEFHDGTTVVLTEDSLVYLRRSGRQLVGVPPRAVEIVEGQAEVAARRPVGSDDAVEILVGGARAVTRSDDRGVAQARARRTEDDAAKVMVYEGGGEVESGGRKVEVARGMGTSVEKGSPPAPPEKLLPAPTGLVPRPGTRLTFNDVRLTWKAVEAAVSYTAELCSDENCALLVERRVGLTETAWKPEPPAQGDYFWRVNAVSASGLDGYPSAPAALAVLGGPDRVGPSGKLVVTGRQLRFGGRLIVDEQVRVEPRLRDRQSGVAGWKPIIDGVEVSRSRWFGTWPDGTYRLAVRASDRVGNESVIEADEELIVDALPPVINVSGVGMPPAGRRVRDRSRCGWLPPASARWPAVTQCRWVRKAQRRWLRRGWNWLEVSVDGRRWNPLIAAGSGPAREVAEAAYRLPPAPASMIVDGDHAQLLVRSANGEPLMLPGGALTTPGLRIGVGDAVAGVERLELRVEQGDGGGLSLFIQGTDALGHSHSLEWPATHGG